jgi:hypothetical protein
MLFKLEKSKPFILRTTPKKTPENAPTQKYETPDIHPLPDAQSRNDADRGAPLTSVAHQPLFYLLPQ